MRDPIIITGAARSGTSMVTGLLARSGVALGPTQPANEANPGGFFENTDIRQRCVKGVLKEAGADPLGVRHFPDPGYRPSFSIRDCVHREAKGSAGELPWGFKAIKALPVWRAWAEAFPDAFWICVRRPMEDVVASCLRTEMMAQHSQRPEFWRDWWQKHQDWMDELREELPERSFDVHSAELAADRHSSITAAIRGMQGEHPELRWEPFEARSWIRPEWFKGAGDE